MDSVGLGRLSVIIPHFTRSNHFLNNSFEPASDVDIDICFEIVKECFV